MLAVNAVFAPAADTHLDLTHTPLGLTPDRFKGSLERCSTTAYRGIDMPDTDSKSTAESLEACIALCVKDAQACSYLYFDNARNCYLNPSRSSPMVEFKNSAEVSSDAGLVHTRRLGNTSHGHYGPPAGPLSRFGK